MSEMSDSKSRLSELRARATKGLESMECSLRQESSRILSSKQVNGSGDKESSLSPEEIRSLVHELSVYQTELELQNEQLRATELELQKSRDDYFDLYDNAPVGYLILTEKGFISNSNREAVRLLGIDRIELLKRLLSAFMSEKDADTLRRLIKHSFIPGEHVKFEDKLARPDAAEFYVLVDGSALVDENGSSMGLRVIISNITGKRIAEDHLTMLLAINSPGKQILQVRPKHSDVFMNCQS